MTDKEIAMDWLFSGEVGLSSQTICCVFLAHRLPRGGPSMPLDTDDFARCRLFLERLSAEGQKQALDTTALCYPDWGPLVREWQRVCESMDAECPDWRTGGTRWGVKTYTMIGVLRVEGLRIVYPEAVIELNADGTLRSMRTKKPEGVKT